jgi:3-dehydroquinate dehydratase type I
MICTSVVEPDFKRCLRIVSKSELSEIRLDLVDFTDEQIKKLFSTQAKTIATCRPGKFSDEERKRKLAIAVESGATYIDIEVDAAEDVKQELLMLASEHGCKLIISYHNYEITPSAEKLENYVQQCIEGGADVVKIATMVNAPKDNARILGLYRPGLKMVAIGMGEEGKISRVASLFMGAEFTFASTTNKTRTAPGQFTIKRLRRLISLIEKK